MAELTPLDEKLAEVMGLAQAAQDTTAKVGKMVEDEQISEMLDRMQDEARETEERCEAIVEELDGKKTAVQEKARETKQEAAAMRDDYLGDGGDALDGLEFMIMAEAGELGHVEIVGAMGAETGDQQIQQLVEWAQPIQQRHFEQTREAALELAKREASG
jgi:hypothetical protein